MDTNTKWQVIDIPSHHPQYGTVGRSQMFENYDAAKDFALHNGGRLFWIRDGVLAFQNLSKRTPEQII